MGASSQFALFAPSLSFDQILTFFLPRLAVAIVCGGMVGLERELKHKAAGIKTNILICLGSALFTSVSVLIAGEYAAQGHFGDPGRLAAQIVSGIGFLGGGAILQSRGAIVGLTTAATIWVVAAIGVCIGIGYWHVGLGSSILVVAILVGTTLFEDRVLARAHSMACEVVVHALHGSELALVREQVQLLLGRHNLILDQFEMRALLDGKTALSLQYEGRRSDQIKFIRELWAISSITQVRQN